MTLARRPASPALWRALTGGALALVATSAVLSHAVARVESRTALVVLDALHQVAAAVWIGGLAHLTAYAALPAPGAARDLGGRRRAGDRAVLEPGAGLGRHAGGDGRPADLGLRGRRAPHCSAPPTA